MRYMIVSGDVNGMVGRYVVEMTTAGQRDSQTFHAFLCEYDPGWEYTVKFSQHRPKRWTDQR